MSPAIDKSGSEPLESLTFHELARAFHFGALALILVLFPFSLFFLVGGFLPDRFSWASSIVISLNAIATFSSEIRFTESRVVIRETLFLCLLVFVIESFGVHTGLPFGRYSYTGALGPNILGVPVVIPFAWYSTVVNSRRLISGLFPRISTGRVFASIVLAGILTLALDIVLEPTAGFIKEYWIWHDGVVPMSNYASWFLLSSLVIYWMTRKANQGESENPERLFNAIIVLGTQWVLFALTDIVNGYFLPVAVSALLVAAIANIRAGIVSDLPIPE
jgi:putative membrane protein